MKYFLKLIFVLCLKNVLCQNLHIDFVCPSNFVLQNETCVNCDNCSNVGVNISQNISEIKFFDLNISVLDYNTFKRERLDVSICTGGSFSLSNQSICSFCGPGLFSKDAASTCSKCTPGTYSLQNFSSCALCSLGSYSSAASSACLKCPPGTFSQYTYQELVEECNICPAGSFSLHGFSACEFCNAGSYSSSKSSGCLSCTPGSFSSKVGSSSCMWCDAGYIPDSNSSSCLSCSPGTFSNFSACLSCGFGFFSSSNSSICQACPPGKSTIIPEASFCEACNPGFYSYKTTSCSTCPMGSYAFLIGQSSCTLCEPGTFSITVPGLADWVCQSCVPGKFSTPGSTTCLECEANLYSGVASGSCLNCPSNSISNPGSSLSGCKCLAGYQYLRTVSPFMCIGCSKGKYSDFDTEICSSCPTGTYGLTFVSTTVSDCVSCEPGKYSDILGAETCKLCRGGTYSSNSGSVICPLCYIGQYSLFGATFCTNCEKGTFNDLPGNSGLSFCQDCASGTYTSRTGSSYCDSCFAGTFSLSRSQNCEKCRVDTYSEVGFAECVPCPDNSTSQEGSSTNGCVCQAGFQHFYRTRGSGGFEVVNGLTQKIHTFTTTSDFQLYRDTFITIICSNGTRVSGNWLEGYYQILPQRFCMDNQVQISYEINGTFFAGRSTAYFKCTPCLPGQISSRSSSQFCDYCPSGSFQSLFSQTACQNCTPGFSAYGGSSTCQKCSPGFVAPGVSMESCYECPRGYKEVMNQQCVVCMNGTFSNGGSSSCTQCYNNSKSAMGSSEDGCICQRGSYRLEKSCPLCTPGKFSDDENSSFCKSCGMGRFSLLGSSICNLCPIGFANSNFEAEMCFRCPLGSFSAKTGMSSCDTCPATYYCTGGSSLSICPDGSFSNKTGLSNFYQCESCPQNFYCPSPGELQSCPDFTFSKIGSTSVLGCVCEPGYECTYHKQLHASFNLPISISDFELVKQDFINTIASATGVDPSKVKIVNIFPTHPGNRRLLHFKGVTVHIHIFGAHRIDKTKLKAYNGKFKHMHRIRVTRKIDYKKMY